MQNRSITIDLVLSDEASKIFDQAAYEYDTRFTDELSEVISDCLKRQKCVDINRLVIDVAEECRIIHEAWEDEHRRAWEQVVAVSL